jgi:hypothetical protein
MRLLVLLFSIISLLFIVNATADDNNQPEAEVTSLEKNIKCGAGQIPFLCGGRFYCAVPPVKCCWGIPCGNGGVCTNNPRNPCRPSETAYNPTKNPVYDDEANCACELYGGPFRYEHPHRLNDGRTCACNVYQGQCVLNPSQKCDYHWVNHGACG